MSSQGSVPFTSVEQQLAKLQPLDSTHLTKEKGITRFSGRKVKVVLIASLPFLLAGLLTLLTSLFLPLGLVFGLVTAGYFTASTIASATIFGKTLADRKAKARPAGSVLPFINQSPLPKTPDSSPSPSYPSQIFRTAGTSKLKQELPSLPLPNQKSHTTAVSDQKSTLNQRVLPTQVDDISGSQRPQINPDSYPQIPESADTTPWVEPQSDSLPAPVRPCFPSIRGISQPTIPHQAVINSERSIDTSTAKTDKSFEEAIADAILESLLAPVAGSNLAETADSISDEASISGDSAFSFSSASSQNELSFSDYIFPSTPDTDSNYQSESEDGDNDPSDVSINTLATTSISFQRDNRQATTSDSISLRVSAISQLHDSGDQRERSHSSHSTESQTDTLTSDTIADEWDPSNRSQKSTEQQIDVHNLAQIDNDSFMLEAARKAENDDLQTEKKRTVKHETKVSSQIELSLYKTPTSQRLGFNRRKSGDSEPTKQFQNKIIPGKNNSPSAKKTEPESITRKTAPLSDVPLQEGARNNSSARLSNPLTVQQQSEKKAISDTAGKEAKVTVQSTDICTLSAPDQQTGKRVPALASDRLTTLSEKPITESMTYTSLARASETQVTPTGQNDINSLSPFANGKALYFNGQATDTDGRLQLRLTPGMHGQGSNKAPAFLLKIEEDIIPPTTSEHASSALAVPTRTHRHITVTILINWDNSSSSTAITIKRQITSENFFALGAQLYKSGTCDLTIDKSQLPALQLEKLCALEGESSLEYPDKVTEIDATENLLKTTPNADLLVSIQEASTNTSVYHRQSEQPKKAHSHPVHSELEPVRVTDNTEFPASKQCINYKDLTEDSLPVSSHSMMGSNKQVILEELQPIETPAVIHGDFGNLKGTLNKSRPERMPISPDVQHRGVILGLTDKSRELFNTSSLSPIIATPVRTVEQQRPDELAAQVSTPIENRLLPVEETHTSHKFIAPKGNVTEPASILSDKMVRAQSPSFAHKQHLNVTAESVEEIPGHQLPETINAIATEQAITYSTPSDGVVTSPVPTLALEQALKVTIETVNPAPEVELPEAIQASVTEFDDSKQPVTGILSISTYSIADTDKTLLLGNHSQDDEQVGVYKSKEKKMIESDPPSDESAEEVPSLIVSLANEGTDSLPESDLVSGVLTPTGQSHSLPVLFKEKQPSHDRRGLSLDGHICGYLADNESNSTDTDPIDSDSDSEPYYSLTSQQIPVTKTTGFYEQAGITQYEENTSPLFSMFSTENTPLTSPESDLKTRVFTTTEQSHSLPAFTGAKQPSPLRSALSLDGLNHGHLANTEYSSSDTTPLLSPTGSDFDFANQQTNVLGGADNTPSNHIGAITPHSPYQAVSKNEAGLGDKNKRIRGHVSDPEPTTTTNRFSGGTIPEQLLPHIPELKDDLSFGSFTIVNAQEDSEPNSIVDSDSNDWEYIELSANKVKPFKQELEDATNKPLALLEYLAHYLAYNLDEKSEVKLPGHSDGNQQYKVQKVKEVPDGLNAYILYPENPETGKPVDLKLLFQGTNPGKAASVIRDLEPSGAGYDTMEIAANTITRQLHNILKHYPGRTINLTIAGHSLGGADAQNFFGHFLKSVINAADNEILTANPLLENIKKIVLFTKCSAGVSKKTHERVVYALNLINGREEQTGIKTEIFHLKVEGDIVQATGDCHVGSNLEQKLADVSILQVYPSTNASRVERHTKKYFTDDTNPAPIYWYKWMRNTTDQGIKDIHYSTNDTSSVLRSFPLKRVQHAIHATANYFFESAALKDTTTVEKPKTSTPCTYIRAESDEISAHSSDGTLKE